MEVFNMQLNKSDDLHIGDLLLAEPLMDDPNFKRSVVLICEHDKQEGSFGLVLNKPFDIELGAIDDPLLSERKMFMGGPVEQNTLHFVHTIPTVTDAILLKEGLYWGGNYEEIKKLSADGVLNKSNSRFFIGYSGWGEKQLKDELKGNSWIISRINPDFLFTVEPDKLWKSILQLMGGKYKIFSNFPTDPLLN